MVKRRHFTGEGRNVCPLFHPQTDFVPIRTRISGASTTGSTLLSPPRRSTAMGRAKGALAVAAIALAGGGAYLAGDTAGDLLAPARTLQTATLPVKAVSASSAILAADAAVLDDTTEADVEAAKNRRPAADPLAALTPAEARSLAAASSGATSEAAPEADAETGTFLASGVASYYGRELAGRPTASGERFNPEGLTAAHRTLPLGTRIRVTNPANGRSVVVRVNDRGPFVHGRILDLSHGAARAIGLVSRGHGRVEIERLGRPSRRDRRVVEAPPQTPATPVADSTQG